MAAVVLVVSAIAPGQTVVEYAKECGAKIALVPAFDCSRGVLAAITVDGKIPATYTPGMNCDRPALLPYGPDSDGQCVPFSRALVLRDDARVQISAFCRQKKIRSGDANVYDEIDVIVHSVATGDTCWFEATAPRSDKPLDGKVRPPTETAASRFWDVPSKVAEKTCVRCHDSDPFVYTPYIAQTGQLPRDPFGKYTNIGAAFNRWPKPSAISADGSPCVGCHRIGSLETCKTGIFQSTGRLREDGTDAWAQQYPNSHWMPAGNPLSHAAWDAVYQQSIDRLAACCRNPKAAGCSIAPIGR
jgi:hypothetical protein